MALQIIPVDPSTVEAFEGIQIDMPTLAYIGVDDGKFVGSYGLAWGGQRCWIWLKLDDGKPSYALTVIRRAKTLLAKARQLGEQSVYTPRDKKYSTSEKLLRYLGFEPYSEEHGQEVWRWQH